MVRSHGPSDGIIYEYNKNYKASRKIPKLTHRRQMGHWPNGPMETLHLYLLRFGSDRTIQIQKPDLHCNFLTETSHGNIWGPQPTLAGNYFHSLGPDNGPKAMLLSKTQASWNLAFDLLQCVSHCTEFLVAFTSGSVGLLI
ncbi:hypothetical protein Ancab_016438 [Ancistrocladus abbreviatus]